MYYVLSIIYYVRGVYLYTNTKVLELLFNKSDF